LIAGLCVVWWLANACPAVAAEENQRSLTVCAEPAAMPRTGKAPDGTPQGLEAALAKLLGRHLGRKVEFHWCANSTCAWRCLREGRCDVVLGQAQDSGPTRDVAWSVPYAGGQFGLVVSADAQGVKSLADLHGKRIGLVLGTVALATKDYTVIQVKTREELLSGFRTHQLDAAFLDADFAAWYLHEHPKSSLRLVAEYLPREHWNMAMAVRAKSGDLLVEINRALAQLAESGDIRKAYGDLGITFRPPFTDSARRTAPRHTWRRIRDRGQVVVSMDPDNLPYSCNKGDRPGFDVELARALADQLGVKLRLDWLDIHRETAMGKLLQGECDLVLGAAIDENAFEDDDELTGKVIYSRPYYGTGYMLVQSKHGPHVKSLADLQGPKSKRLATEAGSVADYRLRQRGYLRRLYRNQAAVLKALHGDDIDYAYLWANVGWTLHASSDTMLEIVPNYVPEDQWNIAVAMTQGDDELKRHVDGAIRKIVADGTVARALARYHVPHFSPFPEVQRDTSRQAHDYIHHAVADRGLEPRMQELHTSKDPYSGLKRIRDAGELVVGLDQNNLPFSAAHPKPAGLDYEIAGLLAEQLGVSLRVYWAYSAHDSYPSKLATKKLCDVMLGVMLDDRFGRRVLYSKPYYVATYQRVVRAGIARSGQETLGVEAGVAVRGLEGQQVRSYPSVEAILEAVAAGRLQGGYVMATRAAWLAEQRWPGQLRFVADADTVDRFPICAVVRKTDGDLKTAIDTAFESLRRSGRLAMVFRRCHIPYISPSPRNESSR
jgi:polar amino acid transport system substrate-binding protein